MKFFSHTNSQDEEKKKKIKWREVNELIKFYCGTTVSGNISAITLIYVVLILVLLFERIGGFFCLCNLAY